MQGRADGLGTAGILRVVAHLAHGMMQDMPCICTSKSEGSMACISVQATLQQCTQLCMAAMWQVHIQFCQKARVLHAAHLRACLHCRCLMIGSQQACHTSLSIQLSIQPSSSRVYQTSHWLSLRLAAVGLRSMPGVFLMSVLLCDSRRNARQRLPWPGLPRKAITLLTLDSLPAVLDGQCVDLCCILSNIIWCVTSCCVMFPNVCVID